MPTISLNSALGLDVDGKLVDGAKLPAIFSAFTHLKDLPLDQVPIAEASGKLNFSEPLDVGTGGVSLKVGASGGGSFALLRGGPGALDENDPFGKIAIGADEIYMALGFSFSVQGSAGGSAGPVTLGFEAEREFEIRCYRKFGRVAGAFPAFGKAFADAAASFVLPHDVSDLAQLTGDSVLVLRGAGTVTLSAGASVAMPTSSLASVSLPAGMKLEVSAGGSVAVNAGVTLSGGYQVRLRRVEKGGTELGLYTVKSREIDVTVSGSVGVSANVGSFDLAEKVIGALSPEPAVDVEEFKKALPGEDDEAKKERIEAFQASIGAAISTKLQASIKAAFSALHSHEAVWMLQFDAVASLPSVSAEAITDALHGHFDKLTLPQEQLPAGVHRLSNVLTDTDVHKLTIKVNVLGLVNLISVGKLVQVTTAEHNASGDITLITDVSSASRLQALLVTFGNNKKRLRKLLSENFLIEATYRMQGLGLLSPEFKAKHTYFEIHDSTGRDEMKDSLDIARVFALMTPQQEADRLATRKSFGRTEVYAETGYSNGLVRDAFLQPQGEAPAAALYESIGRSALGALLMGDSGRQASMRLATDDDLWKSLKRSGNRAQFASLFGLPAGTVDVGVEVAGGQFSAITSWAAAMISAGEAMRAVDAVLSGGAASPTDGQVEGARTELKRRLGDVVAHTAEEFGDPLGMMMFYLAANQAASRRVIIDGEEIGRTELSAPGALAAHA